MELVCLVVAIALSCAWAGLRLSRRARAEADRLGAVNRLLETRLERQGREARPLVNSVMKSAPPVPDPALAKVSALAEIVAGMDQEVRISLNAVIGLSERLHINTASEPLTRRQTQSVRDIQASGRRLAGLMESVLDMARLETGELSMVLEAVDPCLLARQACDRLAARAGAARITLWAPPATAGLGVLADRERLEKVLLALVSEAIANTAAGAAVRIETRRTAAGVTIEIHDGGRAPAVGQAMSRCLVEAMNGRLDIRQGQGEGAAFTLTLPPARAAEGRLGASTSGGGKHLAVVQAGRATLLYIEADPAHIALMRHVVAGMGSPPGSLHLHVAETGHEGLTLARDLRPDAIILDANLPGLDGWALKAGLDADPLTRGLPLVALSASADCEDIQRGRDAGFHDYLAKPVNISALARALTTALNAGVNQDRDGRRLLSSQAGADENLAESAGRAA